MKYVPIIQIPEPCHQNWKEMETTENGKFCNNCSKVVIDFTEMNDAQVIAYLKKTNANICGNFNKDQLERPLHLPKKYFVKWNYFNASIFSFLLGNKLIAQNTNTKTDTVLQTSILKPNKQHLTKITGIVTDEKGYPIEGVSISLKGTGIGTFTNDKGFFSITIPANTVHKDTLKISSIGFKEIVIDLQSYQKITMQNDVESLEEVCVKENNRIDRKKHSMGAIATINASVLNKNKSNILYQIVKPIIIAYENLTDTRPIKIYPNPIAKNSLLKVQIYATGNFVINILNSQFKIVSSKIVTTNNKREIIDYVIPSNLSSGIYFIALVDIKTKKVESSKLVIN